MIAIGRLLRSALPQRRLLLALACAASAVTTVSAVTLADFPAKPVRIILPYAAGGGADVLTRLLGQSLGELWKQPVVTDNRPGAGATIGTDMVAKAAPDGMTLLMTAGTMAVSPAAYPNLPYDVQKDFAPITLVAQSPYVLAVNPKLQVQSVAEFLDVARRNPGRLNYGSPGKGTLSHLTFELLKNRTGIDATVVHYKGSNPALSAALSGEIDFVLDTPAAVMQHVGTQKLRALAVTTPKRFRGLPNVPTVAESGYPGFDLSTWFGILAPAGTPKPVIDRVQAEVVKALKDPGVLAKLGDYEIFGSTPDEFGAFLKVEIDKTAKLIEAAGAKID